MNRVFNREFLAAHREQIVKAAAVIVIIAVAFFVFTGKSGEDSDEEAVVSGGTEQTETVQEQGGTDSYSDSGSETGTAGGTQTGSSMMMVDVSGAVNEPNVVQLLPGSRVQDAIDAAGGLKKSADISGINRAAEVKDGEKIDIPFKNRSGTSSGGSYTGQSSEDSYGDSSVSASSTEQAGMVNINTAGSDQLQTLTGIGPALAERIISYREQNGRFANIEEIKNVSGIGDKTFEKFKDSITT